jgi:TonB family protein
MNVDGLSFDPQGADFTAWIQHWKNEVYRNWILPPAASFGMSGQTDLEFVVDRAGTVLDVRIVHGSGVPALDRAARNALASARLFPLPADYRPDTVTFNVSMIVNAPRPPGPGQGNGQ